VLTLVALSGLAVVVWRRRAKQRNPQTKSAPFNLAREARQGQAQRGGGESPLSVADAALLYERAVIELDDLSEPTKLRALKLVAEVIVPLVGTLTLEDLPKVFGGVRQILVEENEDDPGALIVWDDFVRWSRVNLAR
jgi:hypothetical protein